jgi:hypothetical protein
LATFCREAGTTRGEASLRGRRSVIKPKGRSQERAKESSCFSPGFDSHRGR